MANFRQLGFANKTLDKIYDVEIGQDSKLLIESALCTHLFSGDVESAAFAAKLLGKVDVKPDVKAMQDMMKVMSETVVAMKQMNAPGKVIDAEVIEEGDVKELKAVMKQNKGLFARLMGK